MQSTYYKQLYNLAKKLDNLADWEGRHIQAVLDPQAGFEQAMVEMVSGWLRYADAVLHCYGSLMGKDEVLGPDWSGIGTGLRGLLNGDTGRLDCGTLDALLVNILRSQGFDPDVM